MPPFGSNDTSLLKWTCEKQVSSHTHDELSIPLAHFRTEQLIFHHISHTQKRDVPNNETITHTSVDAVPNRL